MVEILSQFTYACKSIEFDTYVQYNSITKRIIWLLCLILGTVSVALKPSEQEYVQIKAHTHTLTQKA